MDTTTPKYSLGKQEDDDSGWGNGEDRDSGWDEEEEDDGSGWGNGGDSDSGCCKEKDDCWGDFTDVGDDERVGGGKVTSNADKQLAEAPSKNVMRLQAMNREYTGFLPNVLGYGTGRRKFESSTARKHLDHAPEVQAGLTHGIGGGALAGGHLLGKRKGSGDMGGVGGMVMGQRQLEEANARARTGLKSNLDLAYQNIANFRNVHRNVHQVGKLEKLETLLEAAVDLQVEFTLCHRYSFTQGLVEVVLHCLHAPSNQINRSMEKGPASGYLIQQDRNQALLDILLLLD
jgi:hypothetical protein